MSTHPLKIRILLADDHTVVRRGIRMVLESAPDLEVVAEAADGIEAVQRALREDIDLAILDVAMPRRTGLQAALELSKQRPDLKILMLSMHEVEQYFFEALKAGASGYVLKTAAGRDLVEACRAAMRGEPFLYPPAVRGIMRDYLERAADGDALREEPLTARELEVLKLVAEAHTSEQIAELLIDQPADGRAPPREPHGQARHARPRAAHPLRDPPRAGGAVSVLVWVLVGSRCGTSPCCCPTASTAASSAPSCTPSPARSSPAGRCPSRACRPTTRRDQAGAVAAPGRARRARRRLLDRLARGGWGVAPMGARTRQT